MDQRTLDQLATLRDKEPRVDALLNEHRDLHTKVEALYAKDHLSEEEEVELHDLKKRKLHVKDELESIAHRQMSA